MQNHAERDIVISVLVCPSVECWCCIETVVNFDRVFSPSGMAITVVISQYVELRNCAGNRACNSGGLEKNAVSV